MIPDVYANLASEDKKMWAGAIAISHFPAGIESRAIDSMGGHCESISANRSQSELLQMSLQFDGEEILLNSLPADVKSTEYRAIKEKSGFDITLAEKARLFSTEQGEAGGISVEPLSSPPRGSILYEA